MRSFLPALFLLLSLSVTAQNTIPPLDGWKQQVQGARYIFTPTEASQSSFTYEIMPLEKNIDAELSDWLNKTAMNTIQEAGCSIPASATPQRRTLQSIHIFGTYAEDKAGKVKNFFLVAYRKADNTVRYARVIYPGSPKNTNLNAALGHFAELATQEGISVNSGKTVNNSDNKQKETTTAKQQRTTPVTAPGQGLKPAEIKGIVINGETGIGVGGMVIIEYRPYLLLQNGSIYRYPTVAPYDLDVAASKIAEPNRWGTWKQEGKTLTVTLPEKGVMKTEQWKKWLVLCKSTGCQRKNKRGIYDHWGRW